MNHIVLLGDSILDNAAYTAGGPDVTAHLRTRLPAGWKVTLLAGDGSVIADVQRQVGRLPADVTHLIVSAGGNNAIRHSSFIAEPAQSVAEVLLRLHEMAREFEQQYQQMLTALLAHALPLALCTIYYPNFADPSVQQALRTGLLVFNDTILRMAFRHGLPVIDLRFVCTTPADYADAIEPSAAGGAKIADAVLRVVSQHDFDQPRAVVYF